jgi:predicted  nucleic acid-binding Zn-ribbon protein
MISEQKVETSTALEKLDNEVKRALLYAIERTAWEGELVRLKRSVEALQKERPISQSALIQDEPNLPAAEQTAGAMVEETAASPGNAENTILDQQLTELSELFKDPGQLITPKGRKKKKSQED